LELPACRLGLQGLIADDVSHFLANLTTSLLMRFFVTYWLFRVLTG
jgi:hypothetical protein